MSYSKVSVDRRMQKFFTKELPFYYWGPAVEIYYATNASYIIRPPDNSRKTLYSNAG